MLTHERISKLLIALSITTGLAIGHLVAPWGYLLCLVTALSLFQYFFTGKCIMKNALDRLGVKYEMPPEKLVFREKKNFTFAVNEGPLSKRLKSISKDLQADQIGSVERNQAPGGVTLSLASTKHDLEAAYNLIYRQYLAYGYTEELAHGMRVNMWNTLPGTYTVVAKKDGRVTGTATYIMDSDAGLPSDEIAREKFKELRAGGRTLCEVSGLAVDTELSESNTVMELFRYGHRMAVDFFGVTDFIMTVNPKHKNFYCKFLRFKELGIMSGVPKVKGAPGVPMRLDLVAAEDNYYRRYSRRKGKLNLYRYFFVDNRKEILQSITDDLFLRSGLFTPGYLHSLFYSRTGILKEDENYAVFTSQWDRVREKQTVYGFMRGKRSGWLSFSRNN